MIAQSYKILLVDDDEDDFVVTEDLLSRAEQVAFQLDWVNTFEEALNVIKQKDHDVYLFDYRLGPKNGLELLDVSLQQGCQKPIILLTGLGDHDIDMEAIKMGAADYLIKGQINTPLLERSILHAIERKRAQLKQAELLEELEAANQELTDFAHIISHDLKAPLRGISSLAFWLATDHADTLDQEAQELLNLLTGRVKRMSDLIDGVLQYSKVGRVKGQKSYIDLNQLIKTIIDSLDPPKHIHITIPSDLPHLYSEEAPLQQVFQNLLSNAVAYIDKPEGYVQIKCQVVGEEWQFSIQDNGCGIAPRYYSRIFQIFQTLTPEEGTGVGLAIVKKIIEMYNGKIWVESEVGQGSVFYFTLPKDVPS